MKIIGVALLMVSFQSFGGWFSGPGEKDKLKVTITQIKKCNKGEVGVSLFNGSEYVVTNIQYSVYGSVKGHSTQYTIRSNIDADDILKKGESADYCISHDRSHQLPKEPLIVALKIDRVTFKDGEEDETL
jgi:hypothetical protein